MAAAPRPAVVSGPFPAGGPWGRARPGHPGGGRHRGDPEARARARGGGGGAGRTGKTGRTSMGSTPA
ncbi:hypothetical protein E0L36_12585 [Streptomyces sp. AJS327]|nr:hypothetical protein [Streptomyces sp. AJS327]